MARKFIKGQATREFVRQVEILLIWTVRFDNGFSAQFHLLFRCTYCSRIYTLAIENKSDFSNISGQMQIYSVKWPIRCKISMATSLSVTLLLHFNQPLSFALNTPLLISFEFSFIMSQNESLAVALYMSKCNPKSSSKIVEAPWWPLTKISLANPKKLLREWDWPRRMVFDSPWSILF